MLNPRMFSMYLVSKKDLMIVQYFFLLLGPRERKKKQLLSLGSTLRNTRRDAEDREGTVHYMALPLRRQQGAKTCPVLPASRDPLFSPRLAREISRTMSRVRETGHMERFGRRVQPQRVSPGPCALPQPPHMAAAVSYGCGSCGRLREITHKA